MAPADKIWQACESVWHESDSASISQDLILMHRISEKIFSHKGYNTLLQMHDFYSGVCNSFANTLDGVKPKVNVLD